MKSEYEYGQVAFLDTNAVHYLSLYIQYAERHELYPFRADATDEASAIQAADDEVQRRYPHSDRGPKSTGGGLRSGLEIVGWTRAEGIRIMYSPFTKLELITGRLRGMAVEAAAQEQIPDRMWTDFWKNEGEVADRLTLEDREAVRDKMAELEATLEKAGIDVQVEGERARDVLELASVVAGYVYMQAMDCLIFAAAAIAGADYLVTTDTYLRKVVNRIRTGQTDEATKQLYERIRQMETVEDMALPVAKKIGDLRKSRTQGLGK